MKILITGAQVLLATLVFFILLEGLCLMAGLPPGGSDFVEAIVIREKLPVKKAPGEIRIFTYGESTMHGCHYAPVSSPAKWFEIYLKDFLPAQKIKVVNFARMGKGSDFTLRTLQETLPYKPDLAVFYLGHNDYSMRHRKDNVLAERETLGYRLRVLSKQSRFLSAVWRQVIRFKMKRNERRYRDEVGYDIIETPVHTGLGGAYASPRSEPFFWENAEFFKTNIDKIVETGKSRKLPFIFYTPVCNLKDFAPNLSVHMKKLSAQELSDWESLYSQGREAQALGNWPEALQLYTNAYAIDPTYADLSFNLGQVYFKLGELDKARTHFEEARDNDAVPLRAPKEIIAVIKGLPLSEGLDVIDTEKAVISQVPGGILGEPMIDDNVHFSIPGQALLARTLATRLAARQWLVAKEAWQWNRERSYEEMLADLKVDNELMFSAYLKMVHFFGDRFENRIRFAQKAIALKPEDPRGYRSLAWTYWLMKDRPKALEVYRKLGELNPAALQEVFKLQPAVQKAFDEPSGNDALPIVTREGAR